MSYEETLNFIHSVQWRGSKLGLSRTRELLEKLGNPEKKLKFVHIAGTNGKGSTAACVESVLRCSGYKTGLYTSPFIRRFNERIQVCGEMISDEELENVVDRIKPFAEAMEDKPTEFEIITAVAMLYFAEKECDIVVLEVGLGGEMDSTNVIDTPEAAVITAIGLDHTRELGETIADIAKAKAGIIKQGSDVIVYGENDEAEKVFWEKCEKMGANLYKPDFSTIKLNGFNLTSCTFDFGKYKNIVLPLAGTYQPKNAALAIKTLEVLAKKGYNITENDIVQGLGGVKWPGRFELLCLSPVFILDGAHNPHGILATADSLKRHFPDKKIVFLTGVMADKDVENMIETIAPLGERFITVTPNNPRAMTGEKLAEVLRAHGCNAESAPDIEAGVRKAIEYAEENGVVCALGSLYFSQDIRLTVEKITGGKSSLA